MPQNPKGKRPASDTADVPEAPVVQNETVPVGASLQTADSPFLSPEVPATPSVDPFAHLSSILSEGSGGAATGALGAMAPTFANVLLSIGAGVAESQAALDKGLIETVTKLRDTKIKVVTEVVQELDDDGLPRATGPELVTEELSLINYVAPSQQVWKNVTLSMDMSVSEISAENGMTFSQDQTTASGRGNSFWGFYGWFDVAANRNSYDQTQRSEYETTWSSGQVRLDATLESRHTEKLPVGVELEIGPKIYFSQGALRESTAAKVTRRSVDVRIQVQKASAAVNPAATIVTSCTGLAWSYATGYTSTTNALGETVVTLTRDVPAGAPVVPVKGKLTVKLGEIVRDFEVTL